MIQAWQTAALSRAKRLPSLASLLGQGGPRPVREQDKTDWQRDFDQQWERERGRGDGG